MAEREASVSQESTDSQKTLKDLVISISLPEDQEARDVLNLPLDDFAARVLTGDLPRDFYPTCERESPRIYSWDESERVYIEK